MMHLSNRIRLKSRLTCGLLLGSGFCHIGHAREINDLGSGDTLVKMVQLLPAAVTALQNSDRAPFSTEKLSGSDLRKRDGAMDLPFLLRFLPSVVVTSDAGAGIGYTGMRIRGSDQSQINVTINGIVLNDAESHQVYWVDLPDVSGSIDVLEIQRGVGSSTNGPGAFGATIALNTLAFSETPGGRLILGAGSFGSLRSSVHWTSGALGPGWFMEGRASQIQSEGYVDRASSDLKSFQLGLGRKWASGHVAYTAILGHERTYQSWYGVPVVAVNGTEEEIWNWASNSFEYGYGSDIERIEDLVERGRQHNFYRYENEVDDYRQDHHQIHWDQTWGKWNGGLTGHYTAGAGFYEQYRPSDALELYGAGPLVIGDSTIEYGEVIRRRWLDNDFGGVAGQVQRSLGSGKLQLGAGVFRYEGNHFGEPIWMEYSGSLSAGHRYYSNNGRKTDRYGYGRFSCLLWGERMQLLAEVQARSVRYQVQGVDHDLGDLWVDDDLFFFNPKAGIDWKPSSEMRWYFSVAQGHREPVRNDYIDRTSSAYPKPESVTDFEWGMERSTDTWSFKAVAYWMQYRDQLVLTGALNDTGSPVHINVDQSLRRGLEWSSFWQPDSDLTWQATCTWSSNKIENFQETVYDYDPEFDMIQVIDHEETDIAFSPNFTAATVLAWDCFNRQRPAGKTLATIEWSSRFVGKQFLDNSSNPNRMLEAYTVSDLRLQWTWLRPSGQRVALSGYLRNVLNSLYSSNGWTYAYRDGGAATTVTETYVYPQAGRHGMLSLEVSF